MTSLANWITRKAAAARIHFRSWRLGRRRARRRRANQQRIERARGWLHVNIDSEAGLFAHLSWCLKIVAYCEWHQLTPHITCTSKQYGENGRDWFNVFFEQSGAGMKSGAETLAIREYEELPFYSSAWLESSLSEATRLQQKYFPVSKHIAARVAGFAAKHFRADVTIGCHFRGTDKAGVEASRVAYDEMTAAIRSALAEIPGEAALFVATDEAAFLGHVRATFPNTPVISADHQRSADGRALHFSGELHGLAHGEEALVDCLLLSRCDRLVKTPSALSAWARIFNPRLPVTLVGRPYAHKMFFPESALYSEKRSQP